MFLIAARECVAVLDRHRVLARSHAIPGGVVHELPANPRCTMRNSAFVT